MKRDAAIIIGAFMMSDDEDLHEAGLAAMCDELENDPHVRRLVEAMRPMVESQIHSFIDELSTPSPLFELLK